jgi:hypothetical protein
MKLKKKIPEINLDKVRYLDQKNTFDSKGKLVNVWGLGMLLILLKFK